MQLRFDENQVLDNIFLHTQSIDGFSEVARDEVADVLFFESVAEVEAHCRAQRIGITQGAGNLPDFQPTQWARIEGAERTVHYEFRDGQLALVTLALTADAESDM